MEPDSADIPKRWFASPRQLEIHRRLDLLGPGPAAFYLDACRIAASEPPFESATHLVAHCLREIEGALLSLLCPPDVEVQGAEKHRRRVEIILDALGLGPDEPAAEKWLALANEGLHAWAHRRGLPEPRPMDQRFMQLWHDTEEILDAVTERMERRYLTYRDRLDGLATKETPTADDIKFLREGVPNNPLALGRFFERVTSPNWLRPLREAGYFRYPPAPRHDPETGHVILPPWPQGWYLAHVATANENAAAEVAGIIAELPETENRRIDAYAVEAALGMPPATAASVVPVICKRMAARPPLLPDEVGKLAVRLVSAHQIGEALTLAEHLLALQCWAPSETEEEPLFPERPRPLPRMERWHYEHVLQAMVPQLIAYAGDRALRLFCDLLEQAVGIGRRETDPPAPHDDSYSWRPAIEDHEQNMDLDVTGDLTSAVRDGAEQLATQGPDQVAAIVAALEQRPWRVFHRIALHLLRRHAEGNMHLVAARLTDRALFDDPDCRYEYVHLLGECFSALSADQQDTILTWIDAGPDLEAERQFHRELTGKELTEEELAQAARAWMRDRLSPIAPQLAGGRREAYEQCVAELGEPRHPEFIVHHETFMGSVGPEWADQLRDMPIDEIVGRLKGFAPTEGFRVPTPRGLGDALTGCVAARPAEFAHAATRFCDVEATYVRAVVDGLKHAIANGDPFPWEPVLGLCAWAVVQQDAVEQDALAQSWDRDPTWRWTRSAIAHLLHDALADTPVAIPLNLREQTWSVIEPLAHDPDPTPELEEGERTSTRGPADLAINTVRGAAMEAVLRYALWVRRHMEQAPDGAERVQRGFQEMPEVRTTLDRHLDPEVDPSPAIRSVYGQWFPWLALLDRAWACEHIDAIFPDAPHLAHLRDAAWETYLRFCRVYNDVVELLWEEYAKAVERVSPQYEPPGPVFNPDKRLAEHLMTIYWRGRVGIGAGGLLDRFYELAPVQLLGDAVSFVGHSLRETEGDIPPEVTDRLRALWSVRLQAAQASSSPAAFADELAEFGWWFASGKLPGDWAIDQLGAVLGLVGRVEPAYMVLERLAEVASDIPGQAVSCVARIALPQARDIGLQVHVEQVRTVLRAGLRSGNAATREAATDAINRLTAGGLEVGDLLSS